MNKLIISETYIPKHIQDIIDSVYVLITKEMNPNDNCEKNIFIMLNLTKEDILWFNKNCRLSGFILDELNHDLKYHSTTNASLESFIINLLCLLAGDNALDQNHVLIESAKLTTKNGCRWNIKNDRIDISGQIYMS